MPDPRPRLPSESTPRTGARGLAGALGLGLLWLVALNAGAHHLLDRAGNNLGYRLIDQKWAIVHRRPEAVAGQAPIVLVLGDSSGNQGVSPAALAAALGDDPADRPTVLNLCVVADALTVHDAWILERWIERHGPPAGVAVVHTYDMWHRVADSSQSAATLARVPIPMWAWGSLAPTVRLSRENWGVLLSSRWAPLYSQDSSLRELIADPARAWNRYTTRAGIAWQTVDANGFLSVSLARPQAVARDTRAHTNFLRVARFRVSPDNRAGLEALAAIARRHDVPLWIAAAPMYRGLWENPALQAYHKDLRAWFAEFEAAHPGVRIVLPEPVAFEDTVMQNADHVNRDGAAIYSRVLGEAIRRELRPGN